MGASGSKSKQEVDDIKAVEEMNEDELSSKDKMFKKAILEIYEELKEVKKPKER